MPTILVCKGHPCTGKSTLATHLAQILHWPVCDKDDAKDCLAPLIACSSTALLGNDVSYDIMFAVAATQLRCGMSVIIDSPCARRALYDRALNLATQVCAQHTIAYITPSSHCTRLCTCDVFAPTANAPQHGARVVLLEVVTSDTNVWRTRLDHRVQQQQRADAHTAQLSTRSMAHKPQSWAALEALISSYGDALQWSAHVQPRIEVDTSTGGVEDWARPVLQSLHAKKP